MSRYVRAEASLRAARHVWRIVPSAAGSLLITHLGRAAGAETMAVSVQRSLGRKRAGDRLCPPSSLEMALARSDRLETVEASPRQRCYCLFPERGAQSSQGGSEATAPLRGIDRSTCGPNCRVAAPTSRSPHAAGRSTQTSRFSACPIAICWLTPSSSAIITCYTARSPDLHLGGGSQGTRRVRFRTDNLCPTLEQGVSPGVSRLGALSRLSLLRQGNGGDAAAKPQAGGGSRSMFRLL
jgi:hypothetical protein